MTPKEKVIELYTKFDKMDFHGLTSHEESAIDCAIIAVDEIIKLDVWDNPFDKVHYGLIFWQQVKEQLMIYEKDKILNQ